MLAKQIDQFLSSIEKHELLLGTCESALNLTNTQEHILMLLAENRELTNTKIADQLQISAAAVTKALKVLQAHELIKTSRARTDERQTLLSLAEAGKPIAAEHAAHHARTLEVYQKLLQNYNPEEQELLSRFLSELTAVFK